MNDLMIAVFLVLMWLGGFIVGRSTERRAK